MNGLLIGVIVVPLLLTLDGYRKGLIRKLVGLAAWVLVLWLVSMTVPYIAEFLKGSTGLYQVIQEGVADSDMEFMQMLRIIGLSDAAGGFVADKVIRIVAFFITLVLVSVVVHGTVLVLDIASKLPILDGANRLLGAASGFCEGMLLIWISFLVIAMFGISEWGLRMLQQIAENDFLTWLFVMNPLFKLFS